MSTAAVSIRGEDPPSFWEGPESDPASSALVFTAGTPSEYLGPAYVIEVAGGEVRVELREGQEVRARLALAFPYRPAEGDTLLVIGRGGDHYVIGVIRGSGSTALAFEGAVDLSATGPLRIASREAVVVEGPEVAVDAGTLRMAAGAVVQKFTSLYQHVRALWTVRARDAETIIDNGSVTRAKSASILAEQAVTVNGKQIHLG
jgi:hypothetical protein